MVTDGGTDDVRIGDVTVRHVDTREYDFAVVASAVLDGTAGLLHLERRYEALPRHNDVLEREAVDSNDELLDRPDAVHLHTRYYGERGDYLGDAHASWRPDRSALVGPGAFLDACRDHFRETASDAYGRVYSDEYRAP